MPIKLNPPSELANEFLTVFDNKLNLEEDKSSTLKSIFYQLDEASKKYLLSHQDRLGNTMLTDAANYSEEQVAITLIELGFDINHYNVNGKSTLLYAVENKLDKLIDILLEKNVDVNYARMKSHSSGPKVGVSALGLASDLGDYETVKKLISHGADINYKDDVGNFPLLFSIGHSEEHFQIFQYLMYQPNIKANTYNKLGYGILEKIIKFGTIEYVPLAINNGAYNKEMHEAIAEQVERNVGLTKIPNSKQEILEIIQFISKYVAVKELNDELKPSSESLTAKKIKI